MVRGSITKGSLLLSVLTAAVLLWAGSQSAMAAGYVYQQHTVNAGVLYPGSAGDVAPGTPASDGSAPYLFYVLNNRPDARPTDLTLVNPQAPATVTTSMARRWGYAQGTSVTPSMAGYWEVPLHDVSSTELQQYDVLYLNASGDTFSPADNEKLRRFVDSGGQLFVEYNSPAGSPGLFTGTNYATGGAGTLALPTSAPAFLRHPLVSQPYLLSAAEVTSLGSPVNAPNGTIIAATTGIDAGEENNVFGPVLLNGNPSAVVAGQLGAGQVVVSGINIGGVISNGNGANFVPPAPPAVISAADLKFLSNLISWSETHPSEYKTSHGNASGGGLSAFSTSWLYPSAATTAAPPAATVWGNFVFAVDSGGLLHGFNAYPGSNLTGPNVVNGTESSTTYPAKPYDEVWPNSISVGPNASAPTVATHNGVTYVFVEKKDGSIVSYDAVTGLAGLTLTKPADATNYTATSYPVPELQNAPAPTYYDGRLYAGQANGTLSIYDLNDASSANIPLDASSTTGEAVLGPPSVGLLPNGDTNVITAIVPGRKNMYTVLLGAHNEQLVQFPQSPAAPLGYRIDHTGRYSLPTLMIDINAVPLSIPYYSNGVTYTGPGNMAATTNPQDPLFAITDYNTFFTDWNTDFAQTVQNNPQVLANLSLISANTVLSLGGTPPPPGGTFSAPAIDRHGNYYYTLTAPNGSYLVGVQNAPLYNNVLLKFRFRMPKTGDDTKYADPGPPVTPWNYTDADGVNYNGTYKLLDYTFVGAPVVDDQGNVYAAAVSGSQATVLCFKGGQGASADTNHFVGTAQVGIDLNQVSFQQVDEGTTVQNNSLGTTGGQQVTVNTIGNLATFNSFGAPGGSANQQIAGNLNEPEPVLIQPNGTGQTTFTNAALLLHTNLSWYVAPFTYSGTLTGLSKVGSSLFLTDGNTLYSLPSVPTVGPGKVAQIAPSRAPLGLNTVSAPPSVGGSVMVVNGLNGIGTLTRQVTVVADNHRILGVDGNGGAIWAVDATTRTAANGGVSKVPFSHPVSLSQFADNEFLVADTGNNRCVRFDSGGNVQWELTRFTDLNGLMGPGQPVTLSQPTSVEPHTHPDTVNAGNVNGTATSYLVADSGNDRLVEVTDYLDQNGNVYVPASGIPQSHILTWVTHTADQSGRRYRYGSATYYPNAASPSGLSIAATVTNARVGPLTGPAQPYTLSSASSDAPGGCLVVFNQTVPQVQFSANPANDLVYVASGFYTASAAATPVYTPYTIRNPRFLSLYKPTIAPPVGSPQYSFLYTDDNGAFDLSFDATTKNAFVAGPGSLQFTPTDYAAMKTPINAQGVAAVVPGNTDQPFVRTNFPFVPTSIQRFNPDSSGNPHYLITQTYAQGEASGRPGSGYGAPGTVASPITYIPPGFGGEVFEVYYDTVTTSPTYQKFVGTGTYAGHTLSRPTLTGPLTQPTFAVRLP